MESIRDFEQVSSIDGVKGYYLVKHDGALVSHKGDNIDDIPICIALCGLNAGAIRTLLGFARFNYLIFSRQCKESLIIFSIRDHFLAVLKEAQATTATLIQKVNEFIEAIDMRPMK